MRHVRRRIAWALAPLTLCACASALREPPTAAELAGESRYGPGEMDGLLAQAERAFGLWTIESVRTASAAWLAAAAADPTRADGWIGATRAAVWLAEHQADAAEREASARLAVQSAQLCTAADPDDPACGYWLGIALGVQARERRTTALDALPRIVELLTHAAERRPDLDHAGPHRVLAWVLVRAPGWPTGPGDPDLGLEHARHAVAVDSSYPPNQMCLAEALAAVDQAEAGRRVLERAASLAREWQASGDPRALEWLDEIEAISRRGWSR